MAGFLDFLFQSQAPVPLPTGQDTTTQFPSWLNASLYNLSGAAANLASQPYTPFPGPTVAQPSDATKSAWNLAESSTGAYKPLLSEAGGALRSAGAPINPNDITTFLNPYQDYVTGALNRNLMTNILPTVQDKFVGAGQSRSPQEAQLTRNAIYDTQQAVGQSLAGGYQGALSSYLQDRSQRAGVGGQMGALGSLTSQLGATDIGQLAASGQSQDIANQANLDAAQSRFSQEQNWPYQQLGFLSNIIRGLPIEAAGKTTQTVGADYLNSQKFTPSPFSTLLGSQMVGSSLGLRKGGAVRRGALSHYREAA